MRQRAQADCKRVKCVCLNSALAHRHVSLAALRSGSDFANFLARPYTLRPLKIASEEQTDESLTVQEISGSGRTWSGSLNRTQHGARKSSLVSGWLQTCASTKNRGSQKQ